jgi:uridylate kinase
VFVYLKQSGELLASQGEAGELWTPEGVRSSTDKVAEAYDVRNELGLRGLVLVSGAGNIIRGEKLRAQGIANGHADVLGRLATIQNTLVLANALRQANVPTATFLTDQMRFEDNSLGDDLKTYTIDGVREAFEREQVVLIGGGTGEDNVTTDNAVMSYAIAHRENFEDDEVLVFKGTKFDGVFDKDPDKYANAKRFARIGAQYMLANHDNYSVVDQSCLQQIIDSGLGMRIYRDGQHDLVTVLGRHNNRSRTIGTLIVSDPDMTTQL